MGKVLIAVSGTGGHVYPGIAVAEELRRRDEARQILFATARGKPAVEWIKRAGFEVRELTIRGFARRPSLSWFVFPFALIAGCFASLSLLWAESPDLVVGTGGYASGPVVLFAAMMGIPTVLLEQNALPGVTTRAGSLIAREVHVADEVVIARLWRRGKAQLSGNPVRASVERGDAAAWRAAHGLPADGPVVLVVGGSQGAMALTEACIDAAKRLGADFDGAMVVQTGTRGAETAATQAKDAPDWLRLVPFLDDMGGAYAAASLAVTRAGAMTLAELSAAGVPSILVPYPYASGDHQTDNAKRHAARGAARVIAQSELTGEGLATQLRELLGEGTKLAAMRQAAAEGESAGARERIADSCERWLRGGGDVVPQDS